MYTHFYVPLRSLHEVKEPLIVSSEESFLPVISIMYFLFLMYKPVFLHPHPCPPVLPYSSLNVCLQYRSLSTVSVPWKTFQGLQTLSPSLIPLDSSIYFHSRCNTFRHFFFSEIGPPLLEILQLIGLS